MDQASGDDMRVVIEPSRPIQIQKSSSSLSLRGKYVARACAQCKRAKVRCEAERDSTGKVSCRRCIASGIADQCFFPGRKPRTASQRSSHRRSRSRSSGSTSSRGESPLRLTRVVESDEEPTVDERPRAQFGGFSYTPGVEAPAPHNPQLCIACNACEIVDDGWIIPQHFGVKTYVPLALSSLCPVCNSNTFEFRGRLPGRRSHEIQGYWNPTPRSDNSSRAAARTSPPPSPRRPDPPPYEERQPAAPHTISSPTATGHLDLSPQGDTNSDTLPCWLSIFWALAGSIPRLITRLHLLLMLWIPRYYENQVREGVLGLGQDPLLDVTRSEDATTHVTASCHLYMERGEGDCYSIYEDEESATKIRMLWMDFVESRVFEWNIIISITLVLIAASPTIFQIPSASNDRLIRTLTFLSISRAISGLVFGIILNLHFRSPLTRTAAYLRSWIRDTRKTEIDLANFWIIVSLPAASTVWSLMLFVSAIFGLVWRTDALHDEGDSNDLQLSPRTAYAVPGHPPLISGLRAAITLLFLIDIGYATWAHIFLQRRMKACSERPGDI